MRDDLSEKIICSSIWYMELELKNPDVLRNRGFSPYNIDRGIVFSGWRHFNCLYQMVAVTGLKQCDVGKEIQGFLTNKNRFVDRKEGMIIAKRESQISDNTYSDTMLYSEDIY